MMRRELVPDEPSLARTRFAAPKSQGDLADGWPDDGRQISQEFSPTPSSFLGKPYGVTHRYLESPSRKALGLNRRGDCANRAAAR
jgi:hypothetical protein